MPDVWGTRYSPFMLCLVTAVLALALMGCDEKPQLHPGSQPATAGGMKFELGDYHLRYLVLTDSDGQVVEYPAPVLAIELTMTNTGEDDFDYDPTHSDSATSERSTPLLYPAPEGEGDEIDWEQFSPRPIEGVLLHRAQWDQQQQESVTLSPGDSVTDYFLFQVPGEDQSDLVFSVPPSMHRGELPVMLRFDYVPTQPEGPTLYEVGDEIDFDGVYFTVTSVEQTYVKVEDASQGEGYSSEPVLKVSYTLRNESGETITFDPAHRNISGDQGAVLDSQAVDFRRFLFPSTARPENQQRGRVDVEPGETIEDFTAFERPREAADLVTFILPASHFDRSGRVRVGFSYTPEEVELPEELQEDD